MNEEDSMFAKEGFLFKVSYIEPSFWEVLMLNALLKSLMEYD